MNRRSTSTRPGPCRPIAWQVVPKPSGGTRRLVVLDPEDELAFARSVVGIAPSLGRALGRESYANRLVGWDPHRGLLLEPWRHARRRWHGDRPATGGRGRFVAVTDVRECYASIAPSVIAGQLRMLGAPPATGRRDRIVAVRIPGRRHRRAPGRAGRIRAACRRRAGGRGSRAPLHGCELRPLGGRRHDLRSRSPREGDGARRPRGGVGFARPGACTSRRPSSWTIHAS